MLYVRQYGLRPPEDWGEDCEDEMRRGNALWNKLVEVERANRAEWSAVFERDPVYAGMKAELDRVNAIIDELWERRKAARRKARAKKTEVEEKCAVAIKEQSVVRSTLWTMMKELRSKLKKTFEAALEEVEANRRAAVKLARQIASAGDETNREIGLRITALRREKEQLMVMKREMKNAVA